MDTRKYQIRQAILEALDKIYPGGRNLDGLERGCNVAQISASRAELLGNARDLEKVGYITNVTGSGREPYWKITSAGTKQINKDMALDEFVWGEEAL